jgi:hypothetical protein
VVAWSAKDFRSYGYRPVRARLGVLKIDEAEAAVVRRICRDYLGGRPPRDIAVALNKGRIQVPAGKPGMPPPSEAAGRGETAFCKRALRRPHRLEPAALH